MDNNSAGDEVDKKTIQKEITELKMTLDKSLNFGNRLINIVLASELL
jgi:hypothetical protein